jgi:hypothetical protein
MRGLVEGRIKIHVFMAGSDPAFSEGCEGPARRTPRARRCILFLL